MKRHALTDAPWAQLADFFPTRPPRRGGQWRDDRLMLDGILWRLNTGAAWRDLPDRFGPWQTVYVRFTALGAGGVLDRLIERLQRRLNASGLIDPDLLCIDGTNVLAAAPRPGRQKKPAAW